jgi:lysozyme family protein
VSSFPTCFKFTLSWEGLWTDSPDDPGGATMKGVTYDQFVAWRHAKGMPTPTMDDLRNISDTELEAFYAVGYWNPIRGDDLVPYAALMVYDFGVNASPHRSAIELQECLGFTGDDVDGWIGPNTIAATRAADAGALLAHLAAAHLAFYATRPPAWRASFLQGVDNRVHSSQTAAAALIPATPAAAKPGQLVS